jgi:hypothetical protein
MVKAMGLQHFYDPLSCAGSQAAREKIAVSGIRNRLNHFVICKMYTQFTNVAAGRGLETHGVGHSLKTGSLARHFYRGADKSLAPKIVIVFVKAQHRNF